MKKILRIIGLIFVGVVISLLIYPFIAKRYDVTFRYSEGQCLTDSQCVWAGDGCGGGHGFCTNQPEQYKNALSTCDINFDFPSNQGYQCGCIKPEKKCGWYGTYNRLFSTFLN